MINARAQAAEHLRRARVELARHADKSDRFAQFQNYRQPGCHLRNARASLALARCWTEEARRQADELVRAKAQLVRAGQRVVEAYEDDRETYARVTITRTCGHSVAHEDAKAAHKDASGFFSRAIERAVKRAGAVRACRYASFRAALNVAKSMQGAF